MLFLSLIIVSLAIGPSLGAIGDPCRRKKDCNQSDRFAYCKLEDIVSGNQTCKCLDDFGLGPNGTCQPTNLCNASQWGENEDQHEARECPGYQYCTNVVGERLLNDQDPHQGVCRMITTEMPDYSWEHCKDGFQLTADGSACLPMLSCTKDDDCKGKQQCLIPLTPVDDQQEESNLTMTRRCLCPKLHLLTSTSRHCKRK